MTRLVLTVMAIAMLLSGCDTFYPPQIVNAYGVAVQSTVTYSNGETATAIWPACLTLFVGKRDVHVEKVVFERDGKLLREFTANEIRAMLERERGARGYFAWVVSPDGVTPITERNEGPCPQY